MPESIESSGSNISSSHSSGKEGLRGGKKWTHVLTAAGLIEEILHEAISKRASDVHIDPQNARSICVRLRLDGLISECGTYGISFHAEVVGRIKILSGLRSDIHDRSQDSTFNFTHSSGRVFDVRVSIAPTYFGENIVMRLIERPADGKGGVGGNDAFQTLDGLGLNERDRASVLQALSSHGGMIIIAGPTGSGKTSTLYAMLDHLQNVHRKNERLIVTIEDPVERPFEGIRQIQIDQERGFTFYQALRGIMRQDPDVIMLGEIRDRETAAAAIHAALSGHLLLTTIHASNAASILPRLADMGVDSYLLASTASLLMSQRLVRKIVSGAKGEFAGRAAISEVIVVTDAIRQAILSRQGAGEIERIAVKEGMTTMRKDGLAKCERGMTIKQEIDRVCGG